MTGGALAPRTSGAPALGVIGAGPITDFHVRALLDCGFRPQAVAARPGSIRIS